MILKHEIDTIFLNKDKAPIPKPTPCWEWIVDKLKEKANKLNEHSHFYIIFSLYKDGRFTYSIEANSDYDNEDFVHTEQESDFSKEDVLACEDLAYYNWINFSITLQPEASECEKVIQFMY